MLSNVKELKQRLTEFWRRQQLTTLLTLMSETAESIRELVFAHRGKSLNIYLLC